MQIQQVIEAWALSTEVSYGSTRGAAPEELAETERMLGRPLPPALHELYAIHNGGEFVRSNLGLWPLLPSDRVLNVATGSDSMREWKWPVPPELILFADDGSDGSYGLWLPEQGRARPLVVELGEDFEAAALAIVGDDLPSFLAGHSAFYLVNFAGDGYDLEPALDALGVPRELRELDLSDDADYYRFLNWTSPNLPDKAPSANQNPWTAEQVAAFAALPD